PRHADVRAAAYRLRARPPYVRGDLQGQALRGRADQVGLMAHFCETYNRTPDAELVIGFDEVWYPSSGAFAIVNEESQPFVCNFPNEAYRVPDLDSEDMVGRREIRALLPGPGFGT